MKPSKFGPNELLNGSYEDNLSEKHNSFWKRFISTFQCKKRLKENTLLFFTVVSVVSGAIIGFLLRKYSNFTPIQRQYFGFPGEIFLRMLKFIILPLITSSLVRLMIIHYFDIFSKSQCVIWLKGNWSSWIGKS